MVETILDLRFEILDSSQNLKKDFKATAVLTMGLYSALSTQQRHMLQRREPPQRSGSSALLNLVLNAVNYELHHQA
ncbi:hypothetical protein I8748_19900 [Nostoc sp. CENA67]|uniref:Uncharacterized protein n=1 Tax=Amazonocrinis nigriterrae CENA67 TaxID=2794033 RepID=A0A8J7HRM7_9NOST|nr:hypothetical protein [Amazonocrinis nigriterrae]MBH8564417.1 hypothetical protein [Amazonocrinis nigriterrae CENA67]